MNALDLLGFVTVDAFWSALAALGFAVLFNVPRRVLVGCGRVGAAGHASRALLMEGFGVSIVAGTLAGATLVGLIGLILARRLRVPAMIFNICGGIPMVPGMFAYSTMLSLIRVVDAPPDAGEAFLISAGINGIRTGLILAAIAIGIALPGMLLRREKPVV